MRTKVFTATFENTCGEYDFGSMQAVRDFEKKYSCKMLTVSEKLIPFSVFRKEYDGESIVDMGRDLSECLDERFNPAVKEIPEMEESPGFWAGKFVVNVIWVPDDENS
ncbi:hypothetical protein hairong_120 [Pseudomonas phage hairong]|nr:hypothetical protein hairong_120 [Pseudomonas phage hairong]